ncbi:NIPSNAP family protein [Hydrogenophaga sp. ZJX-1]|uniref:NIPSNAP family protein n=1 Tax=Hydrogenophaga sp. ZJX-1 TaxID=3404778 RepID=UPI003B287776
MNAVTTPVPWPISSVSSLGKPFVDHRIYTIALRKMPEFLEVFNRLAMPLLMQTLGHPVGFYTSLVGPQNQFVHLWAYDSLADYERRCQARDTHPDFPAYLQASAHLITAQETRLIRAVPMPGWRVVQ